MAFDKKSNFDLELCRVVASEEGEPFFWLLLTPSGTERGSGGVHTVSAADFASGRCLTTALDGARVWSLVCCAFWRARPTISQS